IEAEFSSKFLGRLGERLQLLPQRLGRGWLISRNGANHHQKESGQQQRSKPLATRQEMTGHRSPRFLLGTGRTDEPSKPRLDFGDDYTWVEVGRYSVRRRRANRRGGHLLFRVRFQTSLSMLLPATTHRAS